MDESRCETISGNSEVKIVTIPFDAWSKVNLKKRLGT